MLVFEFVDVPQKVLLGIVAVYELDANVVDVEEHFGELIGDLRGRDDAEAFHVFEPRY